MRFLALVLVLAVSWTRAPAQTTLTFVFDEASPPFSTVAPSGTVTGLFPDLVDLVAAQWPGVKVIKIGLPWARAQAMVERGEADGFLTYPSQARQNYALFAEAPLFTEDIGFLVFRKGSPSAAKLRAARTLQDLEGLRMNVAVGSDWEQDNIPSAVQRVTSATDALKLTLLIRRGDGDFTIMGQEQLAWWARSLNLTDQVDWQKVGFLPDSEVPFHLGFRRSLPWAETLLRSTNKVVATPAFQQALSALLARYRL